MAWAETYMDVIIGSGNLVFAIKKPPKLGAGNYFEDKVMT